MTKLIFEKTYDEAERRGITERGWILNRPKQMYKNPNHLFTLHENLKRDPEKNNMYLFRYEPKTRRDLPYYDTLPLTLVLEIKRNGLFGINFHYMPPIMRRKMLSMLMEADTEQKFNRIIRSKEIHTSVKFYLRNQIKSYLLEINKKEWDLIGELRIEQFRKEMKTTVWNKTMGAL